MSDVAPNESDAAGGSVSTIRKAGVTWSTYCTQTEEDIATHYTSDGQYKVVVSDKDGDASDWAVYHYDLRNEERSNALADGQVPEMGKTERYHQDIAFDIAIAALRAIQAKPKGNDQWAIP
jgi:hypothetical protein